MHRLVAIALVLSALVVTSAAFAQSFGVQLGATKGPVQPIPFSHRVHAGKLNMACRYCHYGAWKSPWANIPAMSTCMGCHKMVATDRPNIQKLADFYNRGEPIPWVKVHYLPDHVKFNHKRHVLAGFACQECHGPVQTMDVVYQYNSLKMGWCISCHRKNLDNKDHPATMDCVACHH
ncbi:MAG TPA: cytochrome c3 family protein [Candidatus Acidoferrales bacterium]|nr:cytochrome c3 family protein [Candidatus Acidoferrales bacterium]